MDAKTHGYKEGLLESGEIGTLGAEGADLTVKMVVAVGHEKYGCNIYHKLHVLLSKVHPEGR